MYKDVNKFYTLFMKQSELLRRSFTEFMLDVATSTVGHIVAFDPLTQLAQIQIGIVKVKSTGETFEPAVIVECPVYFSGGSQFMIEHQIDMGDEGVILFGQRCIDGWRETGGVAQQPIIRYHDVNDAMFLPGMRSKPNALSNFNNNGIRMRNADGSNYIWLKSDGTAEITVNDLKINANVAITGDVTANGVNIGSTHSHLPGTYSNGGGAVSGTSGTPTP